jgi:hypothetical protein
VKITSIATIRIHRLALTDLIGPTATVLCDPAVDLRGGAWPPVGRTAGHAPGSYLAASGHDFMATECATRRHSTGWG